MAYNPALYYPQFQQPYQYNAPMMQPNTRMVEVMPVDSVESAREYPVPIGSAHLVPSEADGLSSLMNRACVDFGNGAFPTRAHAVVGTNRRRRRGQSSQRSERHGNKQHQADKGFSDVFSFHHESSFQKIKAEVALCRSIKLFGFLNHMYHQHLSELFFTASLRRPAVGQGSRTSHPHRT